MSRLSPLRLRSASLRLGTTMAGYACLVWLSLAPVHPSYSGGSALLDCHASPAHDARLPSDSGHKQAGCAVLGLHPSLRSIRAVCNGSALLCCHASPVRNGWLPSDSGQAWRAMPALCLSLTSVHPACSRRLSASCYPQRSIITWANSLAESIKSAMRTRSSAPWRWVSNPGRVQPKATPPGISCT